MTIRTHAVIMAATMATAATGLWACNDSPTRPNPVVVPNPTTVAVQPLVSSVSIEGPDTVALGETVQFQLTGHMTDGSERDLTQDAEWSHLGGDALSVDGKGLVTGREPGQSEIAVRFQHYAAAKLVIALPRGTYRVIGWVRETGGGPPLSDALVQITSGAGAGLSAVTDYRGFYALFGVAGDTTFRASKEGYYTTIIDRIMITENQEFGLRLDPLKPHADVSGTYTLSLAAAAECGQGLGRQSLPEEAAQRTYAANVQQRGGTLLVSVKTTGREPSTIHGRLEATRATFELLMPSHYDDPPLAFADMVSDSRMLTVYGIVWTPLTRNRFEGSLDGRFQVFENGRGPIAECESKHHRFTMSR